jgi:hypothetical protein
MAVWSSGLRAKAAQFLNTFYAALPLARRGRAAKARPDAPSPDTSIIKVVGIGGRRPQDSLVGQQQATIVGA